MPFLPRVSDLAANIAANAICTLLNNGKLLIYSGLQPLTADDDILEDNILLVELHFKSPAFQPAIVGIAQSYPISSVFALATGKATWFRCVTENNESVCDGDIGIRDTVMVLNTLNVEKNVIFEIERFNFIAWKE